MDHVLRWKRSEHDGEELIYGPGDLLANVLLHEREHHGDINTLLYQMGVEVPQTAYRFFLLESRS